MGFFSRGKPDADKLDELIKSGEFVIDDSDEYMALSKALSRFKNTLYEPVKKAEEEVKAEVKAVETAVKVDVKRVETAVSNDLSMIRVPKRVKDRLREQRQGTETYGETIERLLNVLTDTSRGV